MALTISPEQFPEIKDNKRFEDLLFVDLNIDSWFLQQQFAISDCAFRNCNFGGEVNFINGVFKNVTFQDCEFDSVNFENLVINNTKFLTSKLRGECVFKRASFNNCGFSDCFIVGADFSHSMMVGTTFNRGSFVHNNIQGLNYRVTGNLFNSMEQFEGNTGQIKRI